MHIIFIFFAAIFCAAGAIESHEIAVMHQGRLRPLSLLDKPFTEDLLVIPDKRKEEWRPLTAVMQSSDYNFSKFPDPLYFSLVDALTRKDLNAAEKLLQDQSAFNLRFEIEKIYLKFPWKVVTVGAYTLAGLLFLFNFWRLGLSAFSIALLLHTLILVFRSYVLMRPPVSNMQETVLYVPWIGSLLALGFTLGFKDSLPCLVGSLLSAILLLTPISEGMENLQPVLNSHFWLIVHVLMIVASYGVLLFAGLAGHLFLLTESPRSARLLLPALYIGVALLIPGTILGGVWAAESWGRFWDWDPKESWAFISASVYLVVIHAWRYGKIGTFGLAIGSIIGLMSISFTWYGVNYILGTGLHSYGFGSGGEIFYWIFLVIELIIISIALIIRRLKFNSHCDN